MNNKPSQLSEHSVKQILQNIEENVIAARDEIIKYRHAIVDLRCGHSGDVILGEHYDYLGTLEANVYCLGLSVQRLLIEAMDANARLRRNIQRECLKQRGLALYGGAANIANIRLQVIECQACGAVLSEGQQDWLKELEKAAGSKERSK